MKKCKTVVKNSIPLTTLKTSVASAAENSTEKVTKD